MNQQIMRREFIDLLTKGVGDISELASAFELDRYMRSEAQDIKDAEEAHRLSMDKISMELMSTKPVIDPPVPPNWDIKL